MRPSDLRQRLRRPCVRMQIGGYRPAGTPAESWFGKVLLAAPGEAWPSSGGAPLHPLFQLDVTALPLRPKGLEDVALVTAFIAGDHLPVSTPNGEGWLVRTYPSLEGLVPAAPPPGARSPIRAAAMRPGPVEDDHPAFEDVPEELAEDWEDADGEEKLPNLDGFKLGGWPRLIQGELPWAPLDGHPARPEYVFQVDGVEKCRWAWGDGGVGYYARGTAPGHEQVWALEWQCL